MYTPTLLISLSGRFEKCSQTDAPQALQQPCLFSSRMNRSWHKTVSLCIPCIVQPNLQQFICCRKYHSNSNQWTQSLSFKLHHHIQLNTVLTTCFCELFYCTIPCLLILSLDSEYQGSTVKFIPIILSCPEEGVLLILFSTVLPYYCIKELIEVIDTPKDL